MVTSVDYVLNSQIYISKCPLTESLSNIGRYYSCTAVISRGLKTFKDKLKDNHLTSWSYPWLKIFQWAVISFLFVVVFCSFYCYLNSYCHYAFVFLLCIVSFFILFYLRSVDITILWRDRIHNLHLRTPRLPVPSPLFKT